MDIDEALAKVGGYRRWHLTMFGLLGFSIFTPIAWQGLIIVFTGWEPPHRCKLLDDQSVNHSIPVTMGSDGKEALSKCSMYPNTSTEWNTSMSTTECLHGWEYDNEGFYTIIEQWDLVCQRNYLSELSQTMYTVGFLVSTLGLSFLMDKFGRKLVHILSHLAICGVGIGVAFSPNYITFTILRLFLGVLITVNVNSGMTYLMELFDSKRRTFAAIGTGFQWVIIYLLLPVGAYFIQDWRVLQIVISSSSAIWIIYFWILPESPLWLSAMDQCEEAEVILRKMARWNNVAMGDDLILLERISSSKEMSMTNLETAKNTVQVPPQEITCKGSLIEDDNSSEKQALKGMTTFSVNSPIENGLPHENVKHMFSSPYKYPEMALICDGRLLLVLVISNLLYFANCLVYYGLILNTPSLAGNRFINFSIMGLVEIPAMLASYYTADKYGRRLSTCVYHILAGLPLAVVVFVPTVTSTGVDLTPLISTLIMLSKCGITASFTIILLYTRELFPTNVRGTGGGIGQVLGGIGNIIAPFTVYLSKTDLVWLPNVAFGAISIIVGLLVLLLPETANKPLPQTLDDLHVMFESMSSKNKNKAHSRDVEEDGKLKHESESDEDITNHAVGENEY